MGLCAVHKEDGVACFHDRLDRDAHVGISGANPVRHSVVRLVAGGDARKSASFRFAVVDLPGYGHASDVGTTVLMAIGDVGAMGLSVSVHRMASCAVDADDEHRSVIQAEPSFAHDAQPRDHRWVRQHLAKRVAVGLREFEDAR